MKKFLKIMACAMMVIAMVSVMSSCKKEYTRDVVYKADLSGSHFNYPSDDFGNVADYLNKCGAMGLDEHKVYTVTSHISDEDCYAQADVSAKSDFAIATSKMNVEEAQALISAGSYFNYIWFRTDGSGNIIKIGTWECPAIPVPTEYGKLNIDGTDYTVTDATKASLTGDNPGTEMILFAGNAHFTLMVSGLEQSGIIPEGNFYIDNAQNTGIVDVNEKYYFITGTSCSITKNGGYYKFVSSGTATDKDGNSITYSLNCDKVVFTN